MVIVQSRKLILVSTKHQCYLVDEAHALGVLVQQAKDSFKCWGCKITFYRIMTFGKGLGCHGAAILGSVELRDYCKFCPVYT
jgi:8-amino-7-oxononanoate synthase